MSQLKRMIQIAAGGIAAGLASCQAQSPVPETSAEDHREPFRLIVGQDLAALRGYHAADLPAPHGVTVYLSLMNLLNPEADYGGLGVDENLQPITVETDWGGGPTSAWKAVDEFDADAIAIGLNFADYANDGLIDRLVAGELDANIDHLAQFFIAIDRIVYLRVGYEFDGVWNPGYDNRERYVAAYRRIVDRIRAAGAEKVQFVWQSATSPIDDVIDGQHEDLADWYPGDDYVDWTGISWFLPPDDRQQVSDATGPINVSSRELVQEMLDLSRARGKPLMIAEAAPQGFDLRDGTRGNISPVWDGPAGEGRIALTEEEIWEVWYQPLFDFLAAEADTVRALAYIDVRWDEQGLWDAPYEGGYWGDSRVEVTETFSARWRDAVSRLQEH